MQKDNAESSICRTTIFAMCRRTCTRRDIDEGDRGMSIKEAESAVLTHDSDKRFTEYYAHASQSAVTLHRIRSIRDSTLKVASAHGLTKPVLDVADIGCGAGTQSFLWAELGHKVHGLDINQPLLEVARQRAGESCWSIEFQ